MTEIKKINKTVKSKASLSKDNQRARLSYRKSNRYLYLQIVSYVGKTLYSVSSNNIDKAIKPNTVAAAKIISTKMAEYLLSKQIIDIRFDRGRFKYHGKAKVCADHIRSLGLNF